MNSNLLIIILTVIDVMVALLLIAVILVQQSKDGGFGGSAFGGAGEAVFGGQAGDHLSKFTVILTTMFFVITLFLAIVTGRRGGEMSVVEGDGAISELTSSTQEKAAPKENIIEEIAGAKEEKPAKSIKPAAKTIKIKPKQANDKIVVPVTEKPSVTKPAKKTEDEKPAAK